MKRMNSWTRMIMAAALAGAPTWVCADTIWISSSGGNALEQANIKVLRVAGDKIFFNSASGAETSRQLGQVTRIKIDDEPVFTAAEDAFAAGDFDKATDGYQKTLKGSSKEWLKDWSAIRLIESANKAGRFDAAARGYVALVLKDVNLADRQKPQMPDAGSTYLDTAAEETKKALSSRLSDQQQLALLTFLLEIHRARNDSAAAGQVADQMLKLGGTSDATGTGEKAQGLVGAVADMKLGLARVALDKKEYAKALKEIEDNRAVFTQPQQQADALFVIAEARNGLAKEDPEALKEAALAYMRVVAHFKNEPDAPHVAESLFKTAQVMERLKDEQAALALYQQLFAEYAQSPLAGKAREQIERLRG